MAMIFKKVLATVAAAVLIGGVSQTHAANITLQDGPGVLLIDDQSAAIHSWNINGTQVMGLVQWFVRVGDTNPTQSLDQFTLEAHTPAVTDSGEPGNDTAAFSFIASSPAFRFELTYSFTEGQLHDQFSVQNLSGGPLEFNLFRYSNIVLNNPSNATIDNTADQIPVPYTQYNGFNEVVQVDGLSTANISAVPTNANPGLALIPEMALVPVTLNKLTSGFTGDLNGSTNAVGVGDVSNTFQWVIPLTAGDSQSGSVNTMIQLEGGGGGDLVPIPAAAAMALPALAGLIARRRGAKRLLG